MSIFEDMSLEELQSHLAWWNTHKESSHFTAMQVIPTLEDLIKEKQTEETNHENARGSN